MAQSLIHGIDVGTTKIVALTGRIDTQRGTVEVLSVGEAPSHGLKRGVVVDREAAADSVAEAMNACGMGDVPVVVGIAGSHISSFNTEVTLLNRSRNLSVTDRFVRKLEYEARQVSVDEDDQVIHVIPRSYVLDGSEGVQQPVGLAARKVMMRAHVVTGAISSIQNLLYAVEDCGVRVAQVVLEPLASVEACLRAADRDAGVVLIDIGGGTTDMAVFLKGTLVHTAVIPIGGESFTSDVAYGLKVPYEIAERLKVRYGTVLSRIVDSVAAVEINNRHYNAHFLSQILEYRAQEVFEYVNNSLKENGLRTQISGDTVLTGGGSLLDGMTELAEDVLGIPARTAAPYAARGDFNVLRKPQYSTSVGLLNFAARQTKAKAQSKGARVNSFGSIVEAIKGWFRGV
ncbi:MAG: cell division protein FtsA [Actinomycetota bacterium]|nr:cell division protein FtsA [Actinomycetota bacterium]